MIREAASRGARLAVFPEAFIGGFPKGASFGAPIGLRKPEGREAFRYICNDWAVIAILTLIAWGLIRIGVQRTWMSAYRGEADIAN
jgi:hypothetical protein